MQKQSILRGTQMRNLEINFSQDDIREDYGENTVAVQVRNLPLHLNTDLIINENQVAVVSNDRKGYSETFRESGTINKGNNKWRFATDKTGKYTITCFDKKPRTASISIRDDVCVVCEYLIIDPQEIMKHLTFDSHKDHRDGVRIHIASEGSIIKLIKDRVKNPISGEIDRLEKKGDLLKQRGDINSLVKDCLKQEEDVLKRTGLKIEHVNVLIDQTNSDVAVTQKPEEWSKQLKGMEERLGAKIDEKAEENKRHTSAVGEDNKATTKSEIKGSEERIIANQDKNTEEIKSLFVAERDAFVKVYLDKLKNDKDLSDITKDIKKYFDAKNDQVYDEIKRIAKIIESKQPLTEEEYVQIAETIAHSDPKDLKNTPQLTLNFILDNIAKEWHASAAADVIYHQLEKWLSKKKITSAKFKAEELLRFFKKCPKEVFDEKGECILDKSFKKTGSEIEHQPFKQKEWVLLKDVQGDIQPRNGLKCYFALLDNDVIKNDVNSGSKNTIYQCKKAGKYWGQMNAMRHFGTPDSMKKLSEQGLSDIKVRQKLLIEITKFFKTGAFETEDVLADII